MATLGKIYHNFQDGSVSRTHNFVLEDITKNNRTNYITGNILNCDCFNLFCNVWVCVL